MNKSDFYKIWHGKRGYALSVHGYPMVPFAKYADHDNNDPEYVPSEQEKNPVVETEADWNKFLETEVEVSDLCRNSEEACNIAGVTYEKPYEQARLYPDPGDQLDNIYKALKVLKDSGTDLGTEGNSYVDSITQIKETYPKN
jgi:hypothetical protein